MDGGGKGFLCRRCEPIGLALNKGIIESEIWGNPVLVGPVHIPSNCFGISPKTMVICVRYHERMTRA